MKKDKKITETIERKGVYVMDFKKEALHPRGDTPAQRLQIAVKDFFRTSERMVKSHSKA